ncbi:Uncharacterised protein [uncultured archaeon]|nr:Uncharacterised protein [uncultured archaeon]
MKINKIWIISLIAAIIILIAVFSLIGISIVPFMVLFFKYLIPLAVVGYLIIAARCCLVKMQDSKTSVDIIAMKESIERIEKKVNKIENILEKVSE